MHLQNFSFFANMPLRSSLSMILKLILTTLFLGLLLHLALTTMSNRQSFSFIFKEASPPTYQARFSCPTADQSRLPNSYIVWLAPGYSLQEHAMTIRHNVATHFRSETDVYITSGGKVIYCGFDINDELLRVIRSDENVELVECHTSGTMIGSGVTSEN